MTWVALVCAGLVLFIVAGGFIGIITGAFDADCRTLYVGGLGGHSDIESTLWKEFGEWGTPEVWHA